jgi:replicative DNA helicase
VFVWDPALTLVLATQPRVLRDLWGKPGAEARGVLARPLYALPDPVYETGRTPAADVNVLAEYERRVRALYEDVPLLMLDEDERPLPLTLHLDAAAETLFERYELELAGKRMRLGTSDEAGNEAAYLGWLGKLAGQTARLAACLHAANHWTTGTTTNTTISVTTVAAAIELARYFHAHALVVHGLMGELPEQRRAAVVLDWLRTRTTDELANLTVRDVHRTRGKGTTGPQARAALRLLEEHGYVQIEKQPRVRRGGRASERIHVHPELLHPSVTPDKRDAGTPETSSVGSVGSGARDSSAQDDVQHRDADCRDTRAWRARDCVWRCSSCDPPAFPGEIVEERG